MEHPYNPEAARCACGGRRVLPCLIDVGTDNPALRDLDLYMGLHQPRPTDHNLYMEIVDEVSCRQRPIAATGHGACCACICGMHSKLS